MNSTIAQRKTNRSGKRNRCLSMRNVSTVKVVIARLIEAHKSIQNRANSFFASSNMPSRLHCNAQWPLRSVGSRFTKSLGQVGIAFANIRPSILVTESRCSLSSWLKILFCYFFFLHRFPHSFLQTPICKAHYSNTISLRMYVSVSHSSV